MTLLLFCTQLYISNQVKGTLPNAIALRSEHGLALSFDDDLKDTTAVHITQATLQSELTTAYIPVNLCITDENYYEIMPVELIRGSYFFLEDTPLENKFVVISDLIAVEFFRSIDVIGNTIMINQDLYTICGVYQSNNNIMSVISSNGLDTIYVPYRGVREYEKLPIQMLYIETQTKFIDSVIDEVVNVTQEPLTPDFISNYNDTVAMVTQTPRMTLYLASVLLVILLVVVMMHDLKKGYECYQSDDKKGTYINGGIVASCVIISIVVMILVSFSLYLPSKILPSDNIFDMNHYLDVMIQSIQQHNRFHLYDYHWNYSFVVMVASGIITLLSLVMLFFTWMSGIALFRSFKTQYRE